MDVFAKLSLSTQEEDSLAQILGCKRADLPNRLSSHVAAASEELISMYLGQRVFTRGSDMLENRLFLLIKHAFNGRIPEEQDVCKLFQATATVSRSLIRAVMSKYQYQLKSEIEETLKRLVEGATVAAGEAEVTISVHNLNLVDALNSELADIDTKLSPVQKQRASVGTYVLQPSSYIRLCKRHGIIPKIKEKK